MTKIAVVVALALTVAVGAWVFASTKEQPEKRPERDEALARPMLEAPASNRAVKPDAVVVAPAESAKPAVEAAKARGLDKANWAPHVPFFVKWGAMVAQPNGERIALKDPTVFRGLADLVGTMVEVQPGMEMGELRGLLRDPVVQARMLDAAAAACPTPRSDSSAAWIKRAVAELATLREDGYGHAYAPLHSARREAYMAAEASIPIACRAEFADAARAILFGLGGDLVLPSEVAATVESATLNMGNAWTQMYGVQFPQPQGLPRGAKLPSTELFEQWWSDGSNTLSRLVRDHGDVMALVLKDRAAAWKEHGGAATMAILDLRVAMAELQDRSEALLLMLLDPEQRAKVEQGRPNTLFIAGRL